VKQLVLGSGDAPFLGGGISSSQFREAKGSLVEDGAHQQGDVGGLSGNDLGQCGVDRGLYAVVPWQDGISLVVGGVVAPSYPRGFRSFNHPGGYVSAYHYLLTALPFAVINQSGNP
jgi:hypothetical protein